MRNEYVMQIKEHISMLLWQKDLPDSTRDRGFYLSVKIVTPMYERN